MLQYKVKRYAFIFTYKLTSENCPIIRKGILIYWRPVCSKSCLSVGLYYLYNFAFDNSCKYHSHWKTECLAVCVLKLSLPNVFDC